MKWISVLLLLSSVTAFAQILPENNLYLFDNQKAPANITEKDFNTIIDQVIDAWKPLAAVHGATIDCEKKWSDATVNAYASQTGNTWTVSMFGGLARRKEVTKDGFAMVVCHELGHHFGGFAFYEGDGEWAASEGQADYFATQACAKEIWRNQTAENAKFRTGVDSFVKAKCDAVWSDINDQNICYRTASAGFSLATLLGALGGDPVVHFNTPDTTEVPTTVTSHPEAQCRLDTYFNGGLCNRAFELKDIPGKGHAKGQDSVEAEQDANKVSCSAADGFKEGLRPHCWFKPKT